MPDAGRRPLDRRRDGARRRGGATRDVGAVDRRPRRPQHAADEPVGQRPRHARLLLPQRVGRVSHTAGRRRLARAAALGAAHRLHRTARRRSLRKVRQ